LSTIATPVGSGIFPEGSKYEAKRLLTRILDQNEQKLALFYLHPDADIGLGEPSVAYLRVKCALESKHYDVLRQARVGRLHSEFRPKFGWLLGNLYARAASPDWKDKPDGTHQRNALIKKHLEEQIPGAGPIWMDDEVIEAGRAKGIPFEGRARDALLAELEPLRPKPRLERVIEATIAEVESLLNPGDEQVTKLRNRLSNRLGKLVSR